MTLPVTAPGSPASLRAANQQRVISVLQQQVGAVTISQAEIARQTQLAPATVSNIVRDLTASGLLDTRAGAGRRGTTVRIALAAGVVAGVDVGHRHIAVAVADLQGETLTEDRVAISPTHHHHEALDKVGDMLSTLRGRLPAGSGPLLSIGMGLPAPLDADGVVIPSSILPGWVGIDARAVATDYLLCDVHLENDANLGALAEYHRGSGRGEPCLVYLKASSGLGGGLMLDGKLFRGGAGMAGEIGHLPLDENGPVCRCGSRGCLEAYTSVETVKALLAEQHPDASFADIVAAARHGDVAALRVIEDAGRHLGWGVSMVVKLLSPTCLVIGGELAQAGDLLVDAVRIGMRRHSLGLEGEGIAIRIAELQERSSLVGAVLLALERTELAVPVTAG